MNKASCSQHIGHGFDYIQAFNECRAIFPCQTLSCTCGFDLNAIQLTLWLSKDPILISQAEVEERLQRERQQWRQERDDELANAGSELTELRAALAASRQSSDSSKLETENLRAQLQQLQARMSEQAASQVCLTSQTSHGVAWKLSEISIALL